MLDCPSDELVAAFVDGDGLTAEVRAELHRHIVECPTCLSLVGEVARSLPTAGTTPAIPPAGSPEGSLAWDVIGDISGRQVGPYQLVCLLGRGAMGAVYRARDTTLKRDVAIKFINAGKTGDEMRQRFLREARAVARLRHENVIAIYGVGEDHDIPYQVSEYVEGQDLARLPLPCPPQQVLRIALDLSAGLEAAHDKGVIHRDIKPSNVMLTRDGRAKLVDFGLARFLDAGNAAQDSRGAKTQEGALVGTPRYMAPEALRGQTATPQSDLFSLGLLLCELATGQLPEPGRPLVLPRELDPLLGRCLARCLDLDPARRFPSGAALHAALRGPRRPRAKMLALLGGAALLLGTVGLGSHLASLRSPARPRGVVPGIVRLPGGTFRMGHSDAEIKAECQFQGPRCVMTRMEREQPSRLVTLSPFYLDKYEVTNSEFVDFLLGDRSRFTIGADEKSRQARFVVSQTFPTTLLLDLFQQDDIFVQSDGKVQVRANAARHPVQMVTWDGANLYCQAQGKRLPTEAEWEFAAGGGGGRRYPWGDKEPTSCDGVVIKRYTSEHIRGPCAELPHHTSDVGTAPQDVTPEGIHDLGGNVAEWVQDRYLSRYPSCGTCRDPVVEGPGQQGNSGGIWRMLRGWFHKSKPAVDAGESSEDQRVLRGGAWNSDGLVARTTGRGHFSRTNVCIKGDKGNICLGIGFRCATR